MSRYKAEIERRIENLKATREVAQTRFDKSTLKTYTAKIEMLEDILEIVANSTTTKEKQCNISYGSKNIKICCGTCYWVNDGECDNPESCIDFSWWENQNAH